MIPQDPDALLGRKETAAALTESGFKVSAETLTTKASRGGGHPTSFSVSVRSTAGPIPSNGRAGG
jgi:hypothetical protein